MFNLHLLYVRILIKAGPDGIVKVVTSFLQLHPSISKRQIELKVAEIAIKEKRPSDTTKVCAASVTHPSVISLLIHIRLLTHF